MKSEKHNHEEIKRVLQEVFPAVNPELSRDLWPAMLGRMQGQAAPAVPWYDWALAVLALAFVFLYPKLALLFAYHL